MSLTRKPVRPLMPRPPKAWTFPIVDEIKRYRGAVKLLSEITGFTDQNIYRHIRGSHIPPMDRFCIPIAKALTQITGREYDVWEIWRPKELEKPESPATI